MQIIGKALQIAAAARTVARIPMGLLVGIFF